MTTITSLPTAPSRSDPATFSDRSDALLGALDQFVTETNTVAGEVNANAIAAAASASDAADQVTLAAGQVTLATTQADAAEASATAAAQASNAALWVSGTSYVIGNVTISPTDFQAYRRKTNGAGTTDPSADSTNWTKATASGIANVVTATTATTLTRAPTLLQITPTGYGVAVTLPDATTCSEGGPLHIIDNSKGTYPVRVLNSAGTLLGFVYGGVVSHVSLVDNSSAAGTWTIENNELVGAAAQLLTTSLYGVTKCIDLGSGKELLVGGGNSNIDLYAVVYDNIANAFGSVTLVRNMAGSGSPACDAVLCASNSVLVVSCENGTTAFEAVVLSISGTTITVNTAATATLSANINTFANGCGLIAVGSSFVTSYTVATPAAQIRALSISGTTVTIGSAEVLGGTAGGLIALGDSTHVIAASTATTHLYTKPYLVSGSSLTAGTGTDTNSGTMTLDKLAALGTRWYVGYNDGGSTVMSGVVSLNASGNGTTTITTATLFSAGSLLDAIIVGSTKVLALNNQTTSNANILTDTSGTASAGTAITLSSQTYRACVYVSGTDAIVQDGMTTYLVHKVDCSGVSPVLSQKIAQTNLSNTEIPVFSLTNSVLVRSPNAVFGSSYARSITKTATTVNFAAEVRGMVFDKCIPEVLNQTANTPHRGKSDSERWVTDTTTVITKIECVQ